MEILGILEPLIDIGLPAILMYQLLVVWNRLVVVTDKLINLTEEFESYRDQSEEYRASVQRELRAINAD